MSENQRNDIGVIITSILFAITLLSIFFVPICCSQLNKVLFPSSVVWLVVMLVFYYRIWKAKHRLIKTGFVIVIAAVLLLVIGFLLL
jgi:hypothetical protein